MSLPTCTVSTNNIQNLPDAPNLSSDELKHEFDKSGKDFKDYINEILLPAVERLVKDEKANLEVSINNKILEDNKRKYHIGKIIMSTSDTNPNKYLGFGTWELWGSGKVPVGVDTANTNFDTVEKTGGEESHTLTEQELPKLSGQVAVAWNKYFFEDAQGIVKRRGTQTKVDCINMEGSGFKDNASTGFKVEFGENKAHNILQPYITCYMWKRTA